MYMKKLKLSLVLLASAFSASSFAESPFQGGYANLGVGGINSSFDINQTFQVNPTGEPLNIVFPLSSNNSNFNAIGSLGVGYNFELKNNYILGLELNADIENANVTNTVSGGESTSASQVSNSVQSKLKNNFSALLKPGFLMNQNHTLMYGIIGARWGNFDTESTTNLSIANGEATGNSQTSESGYKPGFVLGLGIQEYIANGFSAGFEYQYTDYGKIASFSSPTILNANGTNIATINKSIDSVKVQTNIFLLNLMYHWGVVQSI